MKELSIIIPVYKTEKYIHECVDSVLREAPKNSEIILVDDGSPDNCPAICDEYAEKDARIRVIHKKNEGVSAARNTGIDMAEGAKIFFLDSDDYVEEGYFNKLMPVSADLVISNYRAFYDDGTADIFGNIEDKEYIGLQEYLLNFHKYFATVFNFPWGKLYKTEILNEKKIRFNPDIIVSEDVIFNVEYYQYCNSIRLLKDAKLQYRQLNNSASRRCFSPLFQWYCTSYQKIKELLIEKEAFSKENEEHFYTHFVGNTVECLLGYWNEEESVREEKYKTICESELLQTAIPYGHSQRNSGILKALKKKDVALLKKEVKNYIFWANVRKKIRSIINVFIHKD